MDTNQLVYNRLNLLLSSATPERRTELAGQSDYDWHAQRLKFEPYCQVLLSGATDEQAAVVLRVSGDDTPNGPNCEHGYAMVS